MRQTLVLLLLSLALAGCVYDSGYGYSNRGYGDRGYVQHGWSAQGWGDRDHPDWHQERGQPGWVR